MYGLHDTSRMDRLHVVTQVAHLEVGRHGVWVALLLLLLLLHKLLLLAMRQVRMTVASGLLLVSLDGRRQPGLERHVHT